MRVGSLWKLPDLIQPHLQPLSVSFTSDGRERIDQILKPTVKDGDPRIALLDQTHYLLLELFLSIQLQVEQVFRLMSVKFNRDL
jgi:hypothetical protein